MWRGYRPGKDLRRTSLCTAPPQTAVVMTIDAMPGQPERPHEPALDAYPIGATDSNIFLCPRCTRPLAVGVSRCPGCRTRLVAGVPLLKASGFIGMGLAVGITLGVGMLGALALLAGPTVATVQPPAAVVPSLAPGQTAGPVPVDTTVPRAATSALRQSTLVNQRLLADADRLRRRMASTGSGAAEIAPLLRSLAWTSGFAGGVASDVATWSDGIGVAKSLASFYASIGRVADQGLSASITNKTAYRDAGRRMLLVLDRLKDLDKASRALAATANVDLPPLIATP